MSNEDIKCKAKKSNIKLWEIGDLLGMNDGNFSRKLRKELSEEEKKKIFNIIQKLAKEKEGGLNGEKERI